MFSVHSACKNTLLVLNLYVNQSSTCDSHLQTHPFSLKLQLATRVLHLYTLAITTCFIVLLKNVKLLSLDFYSQDIVKVLDAVPGLPPAGQVLKMTCAVHLTDLQASGPSPDGQSQNLDHTGMKTRLQSYMEAQQALFNLVRSVFCC